MKALDSKTASQQLAGNVDLARIRLAKAESQLLTAKEQARLSRRRRKEAKLAARRAKKQVRLAKQVVTEAKLALAQAEAKLASLNQRPHKIKTRKKPTKKAAAVPGQKTAARTAAISSRAVSKIKKPVARRTKAKPEVSPIQDAPTFPATVSLELETPIEVLPLSEQLPTQQVVRGIEKIVAQDTGALSEQPGTESTINKQDVLTDQPSPKRDVKKP